MPAQTQAGDLDRKITIRRAQVSPSAYNEPVPAWSDIATLWARRTDASAGEAYRAQEVGAEISARFLVRYSTLAASITPRDLLVHDDKLFNITATREPVGTRNQWIEIDAVARADRG